MRSEAQLQQRETELTQAKVSLEGEIAKLKQEEQRLKAQHFEASENQQKQVRTSLLSQASWQAAVHSTSGCAAGVCRAAVSPFASAPVASQYNSSQSSTLALRIIAPVCEG